MPVPPQCSCSFLLCLSHLTQHLTQSLRFVPNSSCAIPSPPLILFSFASTAFISFRTLILGGTICSGDPVSAQASGRAPNIPLLELFPWYQSLALYCVPP